jgi:hypothetical protein
MFQSFGPTCGPRGPDADRFESAVPPTVRLLWAIRPAVAIGEGAFGHQEQDASRMMARHRVGAVLLQSTPEAHGAREKSRALHPAKLISVESLRASAIIDGDSGSQFHSAPLLAAAVIRIVIEIIIQISIVLAVAL